MHVQCMHDFGDIPMGTMHICCALACIWAGMQVDCSLTFHWRNFR